MVGIRWQTQKWTAAISIAGKQKHIGSYDDETEAARAYDATVRAQSLDRPLNFPDDLSTAPGVYVPKKRKRVASSRFRGATNGEEESDVGVGSEAGVEMLSSDEGEEGDGSVASASRVRPSPYATVVANAGGAIRCHRSPLDRTEKKRMCHGSVALSGVKLIRCGAPRTKVVRKTSWISDISSMKLLQLMLLMHRASLRFRTMPRWCGDFLTLAHRRAHRDLFRSVDRHCCQTSHRCRVVGDFGGTQM